MHKHIYNHFKIRFLIVVVACFLLIVPVLAVPVKQVPVSQKENTIQTTFLYENSNTSSRILGQIPDATQVTVLDSGDTWAKVRFQGVTGYLPQRYLRELRLPDKALQDAATVCLAGADEADVTVWTLESEAAVSAEKEELVAVAQSLVGTPYRWGGTTTAGFDCSGFTSYVYGSVDIPLHRAATPQLQDGIVVGMEELQLGDLVFFERTYASSDTIATHVGIYAGEGLFLHAGNRGVTLSQLDESYYASRYLGARRILLSASDAGAQTPVIETLMREQYTQ